MPTKYQINIEVVHYEAGEIPEADELLLNQARKACEKAYAPYSNFWVGAALRLETGEVIEGANQENAAYPSGLCAERTAVYWTGANRAGQKIEAIAVSARSAAQAHFRSVTPCGACRQALVEYEQKQQSPIRVILEGEDGSCDIFTSVGDLLPMKFILDDKKE